MTALELARLPNPFSSSATITRHDAEKPRQMALEMDKAARRDALKILLNNKDGIVVLPETVLDFNGVPLGSKVTKSLIINNYSEGSIQLKGMTVQGVQSVCKFTADAALRHESESIIAVIEPGGMYTVNVNCIPEMMGRTTDFLLLTFDRCHIGRVLRAVALCPESTVLDEIKVQPPPGLNRSWRKANEMTLTRILDKGALDYVKGVNPLRPPFFPGARFKRNSIPRYLWDIVAEEDDEELLKKHPCIPENLVMSNYLDKFQIALWLEELENVIIRRRYDRENVILQPCGEFLTFEVPGLKDIRPAILIGDPMLIIDKEGGKKYQAFILEIKSDAVYTKLGEDFVGKCRQTPVRIEFGQGRTVYKRCHGAVETAIEYLGEDWLFPKEEIEYKAPRIRFTESTVEELNTLESSTAAVPSVSGFGNVDEENQPVAKRLLLFRKRSQEAAVQRLKLSLAVPLQGRILGRRMASVCAPFKSDTRGPSGRTVALKWFNTALNNEQKDAVRGILRGECRPLPYIIFGPPGTGKTVTVVEAILQVYKLDKHSRTLVVAPSNAAADRLAEQLVASGKVRGSDFARLVGFIRTESNTPEAVKPFCADGEQLMKVVERRLVVTTCITAGQFHQLGFESGHFSYVFIDEAGYCTEPEALVAVSLMALPQGGQVVLAGDPKQLGPVLMSEAARTCGLSLSLLERLAGHALYARNEPNFPESHYNPATATKLVKNYRAHRVLLELPSRLFYDGELEAAAAEEAVNLFKTIDFMKHRGSPLLFHGIQGTSAKERCSPSWYNTAEVIQVIDYVNKLRANGLTNRDIGIITPYRKQVEKIRKVLELVLKPETEALPRVGSIEEFQGGERPVIILSLVRSYRKAENEDDDFDENNNAAESVDHLNFIFSPKRFNVAITRAKSALIVLGNPHVLAKDETWSLFLKFCLERGSYIGCNLPPSVLDTAAAHGSDAEASHGSNAEASLTQQHPPSTIFTGIAQMHSIMLATAANVFGSKVKYSKPHCSDDDDSDSDLD